MLVSDRNYGQRSGFKVPFLNMGAMRFPKNVDDAVKVIRHAIDSGYRYIDTSRFYDDSELKLKVALKDGYREKVILSTKWSPRVSKIEDTDDDSSECMVKRIEESMKRLDVDYLDFYQLWCVQDYADFKNAIRPGGMVDGMIRAKGMGLVGHLGMTSHDSSENIIKALPDLDWCESVLVTYNILNLGRKEALTALKKVGIATTVMNPLSGGILAQDSHIFTSLAKSVGCETPSEMALRYIMSNGDIDCVMNGINSVMDIDRSIAAVEKGGLTLENIARIDTEISGIISNAKDFCTGCKYCLPCPAGIEIPSVMSALAAERYWGRSERAAEIYNGLKEKASDCVKCGQCEAKCTQKLEIIQEMECALNIFGQ